LKDLTGDWVAWGDLGGAQHFASRLVSTPAVACASVALDWVEHSADVVALGHVLANSGIGLLCGFSGQWTSALQILTKGHLYPVGDDLTLVVNAGVHAFPRLLGDVVAVQIALLHKLPRAGVRHRCFVLNLAFGRLGLFLAGTDGAAMFGLEAKGAVAIAGQWLAVGSGHNLHQSQFRCLALAVFTEELSLRLTAGAVGNAIAVGVL
jgi:hypothetical protein